ncbi:MAG: hypothetical protein WCO22_16515 [Betaproteobacteria bacterium]
MNAPQSSADYFEVSKSLSLPARCPILSRCERRAQTIALANDWSLEDCSKRIGLLKPIIKSVGEGAYRIGGKNNFVMGGQCPEVNQFEGTVALIGFSGRPTTKGDYDAYFPDNKFRVLDTGHYSQCAEYAAQSAQAAITAQPKSWMALHYQWVVGTIITLVGTVAALLALK